MAEGKSGESLHFASQSAIIESMKLDMGIAAGSSLGASALQSARTERQNWHEVVAAQHICVTNAAASARLGLHRQPHDIPTTLVKYIPHDHISWQLLRLRDPSGPPTAGTAQGSRAATA